ncbi:hypothetical protein [Thermoproteus tenax]|uniref:Uncharacterized protein n=1 Tax=Thermoproteus tenax (strain ATCC 35583 / DSM 2078 / JCM 9277 / NBRC 100435 / Kra 1) TaxID=768679 RepID=G4RPK1_THETK|nr:hypothetical protein [Thermoproteus tenax]CCC81496.1 conserved hypothetical protein [Thermoproteus tenax Kra 1]
MDIFQRYRSEVARARDIIARGKFLAVVHDGTAHADDTIAAALLYSAGAEEVYRVSQQDEMLEIVRGRRAVIADVGYKYYEALKSAGEVAILDHHAPNGEPEYVELPSSLMQTVEALGLRLRPRMQMLFTAADLVDRFGALSAKRWLGIYGASLNLALSSYFGAVTKGKYADYNFLSLVAEAASSDFDVQDIAEYSKSYSATVGAIDVDPEKYPRALALLRLMKEASRGDTSIYLSPEAYKTGFGIDFSAHAALAVPQLSEYLAKGLSRYFNENIRAIKTAEERRFVIIEKSIKAIAVEDSVSPTALWNALLDLGVLREEEPAIVAVRDLRNPGAYSLWRPDRHKQIDFRKLAGDRVIFRHQSGFMAVVRADSAEDAVKYALMYL